MYTIKIKSGEFKNKKLYLYLKKDKSNQINGEYIIPSRARNFKGFDYLEYLKTKKIYGSIKVSSSNIKVLEKERLNIFLILSNKTRNYIKTTSDRVLPSTTSKLLNGILSGDKNEIEENIIDSFKGSNLSHMLAVSGAHTSYIILGLTFILNRSKVSKRWIYIFTILFLILFMFITNFTPSVIRACTMAILVLASHLVYRKADIWTSISIPLLINLIINPFSINEIGLQLSYLGTIGIILFTKNVERVLNRIKIKEKIPKILSVTISAQIAIMPIMAYRFNTISLTFFISNILATPFLAINLILGFITILISFLSFNLAKMLAILLNVSLKILILISEFVSKLPFSSIIVKTPYLISIIFIYIFFLISNYIYSIYYLKSNLRLFQKRIITHINKKNLQIALGYLIAFIIIFNICSSSYSLFFKELKIYFIDVLQGDSCLIITPYNKKVLIDGGEDLEILTSYLLDRRITSLDYIIISHFDNDHIRSDFLR